MKLSELKFKRVSFRSAPLARILLPNGYLSIYDWRESGRGFSILVFDGLRWKCRYSNLDALTAQALILHYLGADDEAE